MAKKREFLRAKYDRDIYHMNMGYSNALADINERVIALVDMDKIDNRQAQSLMAQVGQILRQLDADNEEVVRYLIEDAYRDGQAEAIFKLTSAATLSEASALSKFSMLNRNTADALFVDTFEDLLAATRNTDRRVKKLVREVVSHEMERLNAQQLGRRTMRNSIVDKLTKEGLSKKIQSEGFVGIVDQAGRRWNLRTYAEMVVRTKMQQAYIEGAREEASRRGVDLAVISSHGAKDACGSYEGAVISMSGETRGFPSYDELLSSNEIFHPNCAHTISPVRDPSILPKEVLKKAEKSTAYAANRLGMTDYNGIKAPTPGQTKRKKSKDNAKEYGFIPSNNINDANSWAAKNLRVAHVDYRGFHVDLANSTNKTLYELAERYPEINDTKWVSTIQARNRAVYEDELASAISRWESRYPGKNNDWYKQQAKRTVKRRSVGGNVYAQSTNHTWQQFEGICFNEKWAGDMEKLKASVASDVRSGFHPVGTEDPTSIMTHEYGHQVDNFLKKNHLRGSVDHLWNKYSTKEIAEGLSEYGTKNSAEFFAEAFGEYIHNPKPRKIASEVGEALENAMKSYRRK